MKLKTQNSKLQWAYKPISPLAHKPISLLCVLSLLLCLQSMSTVFAESSTRHPVGAASFLKIGAGARAIALGGAFVAVADDASAGYWNPAGLTQLPGPVISLADRAPAIDTDYASMALASPIWRLGFLGLGAIYYNCGDVAMYDSHGVNTGTLADREAALILSYAYNLNQLSLGVNTKYVYQDMADEYVSVTSDGIGADISVLYKLYESLTVGAVFHSKHKMTSNIDETTSSEAPLNIRAGVHYKAGMGGDNSLNLMMDFDQTRFYPLKLHMGTELVLYDTFFLRAGMDDLYAETKDADIRYLDLIKKTCKPTFGLGFKWKIGRRGTSPDARQSALIFDYALSVERLGLRNFFTLAYQF
jgi:hypothetical protein